MYIIAQETEVIRNAKERIRRLLEEELESASESN